MHAEMMTYILYVAVTLSTTSYNSVFTQNTMDPEMSKTCECLCGSEIQQMYQMITSLKNKQTEQNDNLIELKTNFTINTEKYLHLQSQIDQLRDKDNALNCNIFTLYY